MEFRIANGSFGISKEPLLTCITFETVSAIRWLTTHTHLCFTHIYNPDSPKGWTLAGLTWTAGVRYISQGSWKRSHTETHSHLFFVSPNVFMDWWNVPSSVIWEWLISQNQWQPMVSCSYGDGQYVNISISLLWMNISSKIIDIFKPW